MVRQAASSSLLALVPPDRDQPTCTVVHSIQGRVRLRFPSDTTSYIQSAMKLLDAQPEIMCLRWVPQARSLTITFDPELSFDHLAARLSQDAANPKVERDPEASRDPQPLVLTSQGVMAAASNRGMSSGLARTDAARSASRWVRRANILDLLDVLVALLKGDLLSAVLSLAVGLAGDELWKWLASRVVTRTAATV
jgi:hypothetical protein